MSEVKQVTAIVSNPTREGDLGRVTIGYYTIAEGLLTMTDGDGKPVRRRHGGDKYQQKLERGNDPDVIAKRLTLSIWRSNTGGDGSGEFNRPLNYPPVGLA